MNPPDVPSPIDLQNMSDALEWERTAMQRPFREEYFEAFYSQLRVLGRSRPKVLELGSGPGFLAHYILSRSQDIEYSLLDFSPAMHTLAQRRLESVDTRGVQFIERNFKEPGWTENLGQYDAILSNQAVHELRHKRYARDLFSQVHGLLKPEGILLFCDHYCGAGGLSNDQLYMSLAEQREALDTAGYEAREVLVKGGRALYCALPKKTQ